MSVATFQVAQRTDVGRVRAVNEDALAVDEPRGLLVLADGIGGHRAGEVASRVAVDAVLDSISREWPTPRHRTASAGRKELPALLLRHAIHFAHKKILSSAQNRPDRHGMGTTIVACLVREGRICIAYVGDSRLYRFDGTKLEQLTRDHSLVEEMTASGQFSAETARRLFGGHVVTRALGIDAALRIDVVEKPLRSKDLILLCSDGLSDMLNDAAIGEILARAHAAESLDEAAEQLVQRANDNGGRDNISVVLARVQQKSGLMRRLRRLWSG